MKYLIIKRRCWILLQNVKFLKKLTGDVRPLPVKFHQIWRPRRVRTRNQRERVIPRNFPILFSRLAINEQDRIREATLSRPLQRLRANLITWEPESNRWSCCHYLGDRSTSQVRLVDCGLKSGPASGFSSALGGVAVTARGLGQARYQTPTWTEKDSNKIRKTKQGFAQIHRDPKLSRRSAPDQTTSLSHLFRWKETSPAIMQDAWVVFTVWRSQ